MPKTLAFRMYPREEALNLEKASPFLVSGALRPPASPGINEKLNRVVLGNGGASICDGRLRRS